MDARPQYPQSLYANYGFPYAQGREFPLVRMGKLSIANPPAFNYSDIKIRHCRRVELFRSLQNLIGYTVRALDGDIGTVADFYFDDFRWQVLYLVVQVDVEDGPRLSLLSPLAFGDLEAEEEAGVFPVRVNRAAVLGSPLLREDEPVSLRHLTAIHTFYQWPIYWDIGDKSEYGPVEEGMSGYPIVEMMTDVEAQRDAFSHSENPHLRSAEEVNGYYINTRDGVQVAHVADFLIEDEDWRVMYIVADAGGQNPNRYVLLSPTWVDEINWPDHEFNLDLKTETVRKSPPYNPEIMLDRDYEEQLYRHYNRKAYWSREK